MRCERVQYPEDGQQLIIREQGKRRSQSKYTNAAADLTDEAQNQASSVV